MLTSIRSLFEELNSSGIRYCHWKSNWTLEASLSGKTDIDLLVDRSDAAQFRQILGRIGFVPTVDPGARPLPAVEHHFALDGEAGLLTHVHAYFRVITGESLAKNYRFPLEEMLLQVTRKEGIVNIPTAGSELIVFVIRMLLKHTTLVELLLLARDWSHVREEISWLATEEARSEAETLLAEWFPYVDSRLFGDALQALMLPYPLWRRLLLGRRVRRELHSLARKGAVRASLGGTLKLIRMARRRLFGSKKGLCPAGGGAVIAVVGSEATGKSTLLSELEDTFGRHLRVKRVHAGKPPGTLLTFFPNLLLPLLRRSLPDHRSARVGEQGDRQDGSAGRGSPARLPFMVRSVLLAHDRRALLTRAYATAANGSMVLCDRYPSSRIGAPDSPQLGELANLPGTSPLRRWLADREARHYAAIPPPDIVIFLTAPLDVTLERNAARAKTEPEGYVRFRHGRSTTIEFDGVPVHRIDTDRPIADTIREVMEIVWAAI